MSLKEAKRAQILEHMTAGKISQTEAAKRIGVTVRQVHRLDKSYRAFGPAGLISKKRGRNPNNRIEPAVLAQAMALIGAHYADFGPKPADPSASPERLYSEIGRLKMELDWLKKSLGSASRRAQAMGRHRRIAGAGPAMRTGGSQPLYGLCAAQGSKTGRAGIDVAGADRRRIHAAPVLRQPQDQDLPAWLGA